MFDIDPTELLIRVPIVLLALTVHEVSHGYFAYRMGDPTAFMQGRLTLNPLKHLDPLGTICLMFAPIGWAKPVPINPLNFHNRRKGILICTAAGPLSNLAQAIIFALLLRGIIYLAGGLGQALDPDGNPVFYVLFMMCFTAVLINLGLGVFNCLPLYPLDGFHISMQLMRPETQQWFAKTAKIGPFLILAVVFLGNMGGINILSSLITPLANLILKYVTGLG